MGVRREIKPSKSDKCPGKHRQSDVQRLVEVGRVVIGGKTALIP